MGRSSSGILLYRLNQGTLEVLLAHPGGPFWRRKDLGVWTIPKGEPEDGEDALAAARREFTEETGFQPSGQALDLGSSRQLGGKVVRVWAIYSDWDPSSLSSTFHLEWPPRSGTYETFPEIDRAEWFPVDVARRKILRGQSVFLDRLELKT